MPATRDGARSDPARFERIGVKAPQSLDTHQESVAPTSQREGLSVRDWVTLLSLAAIQFLNILDFIIVMPLGPRFLDEMGITAKQFGYVVAIYGYASFVAGILAAGWLHRYDRKWTMLALLGCFAASTFYCSTAISIADLLIARAVAGACGGLIGSLVLSTVSELFPESKRGFAIGVVMSAFSFASIFGVPMGLALAERYTSARVPFLMLALACAPFMVALWFSLPRTQSHAGSHSDGYWRTLWETAKAPSHLWGFAFTVLVVLQTFLLVPYLATYCVENLGLPTSRLQWVYMIGGAATLLSSPWIGRFADRFGKIFAYRWVVATAIVPTLAVTHAHGISNAMCVALTTVYMVVTSSRMVTAQAILSSVPAPRWRTSFLSMNGSIQSLAAGVAASVSANIVRKTEAGPLENFWIVGWLGAGFFVLSLFLLPRLKPYATASAVSDNRGLH